MGKNTTHTKVNTPISPSSELSQEVSLHPRYERENMLKYERDILLYFCARSLHFRLTLEPLNTTLTK